MIYYFKISGNHFDKLSNKITRAQNLQIKYVELINLINKTQSNSMLY